MGFSLLHFWHPASAAANRGACDAGSLTNGGVARAFGLAPHRGRAIPGLAHPRAALRGTARGRGAAFAVTGAAALACAGAGLRQRARIRACARWMPLEQALPKRLQRYSPQFSHRIVLRAFLYLILLLDSYLQQDNSVLFARFQVRQNFDDERALVRKPATSRAIAGSYCGHRFSRVMVPTSPARTPPPEPMR